RVERVGPVDPLAITANLDHLRTACIRLAAPVGRAASDAADVDRASKLRLSRVGDVVLTHLAGSPAGDVKELIIHGEVDVCHKRWYRAEPLQERWQLILVRWFGRDRRRLLDVEFAVFAPPGPDRSFEIRCVDYDTHETVLAYRIMRGSHLKRHLVIGAKIDRLDVAPGAKIPEVDMMTILICKQVFRHNSILELWR